MTNPVEENPTPRPGQMFPEDPFGPVKKDKKDDTATAQEVKAFHRKADTDTGTVAIHHTLGPGRNQAAVGNHNHDGASSRKVGEELNLNVTGATVGAALHNLITELQKVMDITDSTTYP